MRVYDTPTHWHWEPDVDPVYEEHMINLYGDNWKQKLEEEHDAYEEAGID